MRADREPGESGGKQTIARQEVEALLDRIRPALHADGGDIELLGMVGNRAKVRLLGACEGCPSAWVTLRLGIERMILEAFPEFEGLVVEESEEGEPYR